MMKSRVIVIVPARNEEASIGQVVRSVKQTLPLTPVLVIDDHSADHTQQAAAAAGAHVLCLSRRHGLAECLRAGYRVALRHGFGTVVRIDGDGRHEAADIPEILRTLYSTGADVVIGSRFLTPRRSQTTWIRSVGIRTLRRVLVPALGQTIHDPTSGFIGVRGRAVELLATSHAPYPEAGALIGLKREGCRIHEIPCRIYPRQAGCSSMTFLTSARYVGQILLSLSHRTSRLRQSGVPPVPDLNW